MSIFSKIGAWLKRAFQYIERDGAKIAVAVTEHIKDVLSNASTGFIATIVDSLSNTHIATDVLAFLNQNIWRILAVELAVEGLPDNPTEQDILNFEQQIVNAFGQLNNKSRFYTTFAAQVYDIIQRTYAATPDIKPTFAEWVAAVEEAFQDYQADKQQFPD